MRARLAFVLLAILAFGGGVAPASAKLLAFVVGNNAYQEVPPLQTAVNDAQAMREALQRAGFSVTLVENGTKRQISRAMAAVEGAISPGDTVLFHYSGHGVEIDGQNWLLPVDVPTAREGEAGLIKDESFNAADIIERFRAKGARQVVAILDACRNNPFAQGGGTRALPATRGLARMEADGGVFIMFSAGSKQEALDRLTPGDGEKTSVFVRSFLPLLARQDLTLIDMAKETQEKVRTLARSAGREQVPAYYDGIVGRVTLTGELPAARAAPPAPVASPDAVPSGNSQSENLFWQSIQNSTDPAMFQAYLDQVEAKAFVGTYKVLAQIKLASLQPKPVPPAAPKPTPPAPAIQQAALPAPAAPRNEPVNADVAACDQAAVDPRDPDKPAGAVGVNLPLAGTETAITACGKAIASPDAPRRTYYQLARAYQQGRQEALSLAQLQKAASLGHGMALYDMAGRYLSGRGVPKDAVKALSLYYKALDGSYTPAVSRIAWMYASGLGASRDYRKAVAIYELGIKVKEPTAYSGLGLLYLKGQGVAKDVGKACDLFRQGAAAGDADSASNLGAKCPPG